MHVLRVASPQMVKLLRIAAAACVLVGIASAFAASTMWHRCSTFCGTRFADPGQGAWLFAAGVSLVAGFVLALCSVLPPWRR